MRRRSARKGAEGIAQFMPATADFRGLVDPFDPIEALKNSASYLHDLQQKFGNLGLAAAAYNAGPGRVSAFLDEPSPAAERDAQLRRHHHRLDRGRMGVAVAAEDSGDHDTAGRALHAARQPDLGAEGGGATVGGLCAALGHAAHGELVGEQGVGDLPHDSEKIRFADRRSRADRDSQPRHRARRRHALQHPHRRRRSALSGKISATSSSPPAGRAWCCGTIGGDALRPNARSRMAAVQRIVIGRRCFAARVRGRNKITPPCRRAA